ncbi:MAG: hypothetical protein IJ338_01180 [Bacteroidaceae bacterium]|nr:hypothetical protein [Bacteroidaceae bacterium]
MGAIILMIIALIGGYFFLKNFERIDRSLFGADNPDYESYGLIPVMLCCLFGAIAVGGTFLQSIFDASWDTNALQRLMLLGVSFVAIFGVYQAFVHQEKTGSIIGKAVFMLLSCALSTVIGALGAVVLIVVLTIVLILYVAAFALGGGGSSKKGKYIIDENGNKVSLKSADLLPSDNLRGSDGKSYRDCGDGTAQRTSDY